MPHSSSLLPIHFFYVSSFVFVLQHCLCLGYDEKLLGLPAATKLQQDPVDTATGTATNTVSTVLQPDCPVPPITVLDPTTLPGAFKDCVSELGIIGQRHPLLGFSTIEVITWYGYPAREYRDVITDDGYILTLHRIPNPGKFPVLLMHGLGGCSDNWTFNGKNNSLAFILWDLGYDVWLGNNRGCSYSRGNLRYSASWNLEYEKYWNFSWHEMGIFDLPAFIKYIQGITKFPKMFYICHSEGCTQMAVGASTDPGKKIVNRDRILAAFLMAPACYVGKSTNPLRVLTPIAENDKLDLGGTLFQGRIDGGRELMQLFGCRIAVLAEVCTPTALLCTACDNAIFFLFGFDAPEMNYTNLPNVLDKYPNTLPYKCVTHFVQSMSSCKFRQYDYGSAENLWRYNASEPPNYQLQNINIDTYFYYCEKDNLCGPEDVIQTASNYNQTFVKNISRIESDYCNHIDFVMSKNAKALMYDPITEEMGIILTKLKQKKPKQE